MDGIADGGFVSVVGINDIDGVSDGCLEFVVGLGVTWKKSAFVSSEGSDDGIDWNIIGIGVGGNDVVSAGSLWQNRIESHFDIINISFDCKSLRFLFVPCDPKSLIRFVLTKRINKAHVESRNLRHFWLLK